MSRRAINHPQKRDATLFVFAGLLAFRIVNAISISTFFQPDEYFQSLEPAWRLSFGDDSGAWITWILLLTPKILQALCAALGDCYTWRLASKLYGRSSKASQAALALTVVSAWQWFCSVRTLSNSIETTLTIFALYHWPWEWVSQTSDRSKPNEPSNLWKCLTAAALACILRPTNIMIWVVIGVASLAFAGDMTRVWTLARRAFLYGGLVLGVSFVSDWTHFGHATFPPLRFLYFNLVQSLAVFYGRNRIDYYFTEGLPLLLTTALPFAVLGVWQALRGGNGTIAAGHARFTLAMAVVVTTMALTSISHKEVRFIYPLLPILHVLAAPALATFSSKGSWPRRGMLALLIGINIAIAGYAGNVHQRGAIDVMHFLRHEQESLIEQGLPAIHSDQNRNISVGFLMPCHSTPWRSHLIHPEIQAWALTCEPPLHVPLAERAQYLDEADQFYADPKSWVELNMEGRPGQSTSDLRPWPRYLVFFEQLQPHLEQALQGSTYEECWRGFNTHWHDDWRRHGDVIVWCLQSS